MIRFPYHKMVKWKEKRKGVRIMTEEEKKIRKKKIRNLSRRLQVTREEAEKYLDDVADGLNDFIKEEKANIKVIGLDEFGIDKK